MQANAVFEGGGVKGIALVGGVYAAYEKGISFNKVAGTSSGSMVASLLAAGYSAEEMKTMIMTTPFLKFLSKSWLHQLGFFGPAFRLLWKKGLYSGEYLEYWMHQKLLAKGIVTFADLEKDQLRIIASDISQGKILILPDDIAKYGMDPKKLPVSKAVRMSISIPYFFDPVVLRRPSSIRRWREPLSKESYYIVDGGLLSNFPLWLFDTPKDDPQAPPVFGFQLVGKNTGIPRKIGGPFSMLQALVSTMLDAHDERYIDKENRYRTIKIPASGVGTTHFEITPKESLQLFESGYRSAEQYFSKWLSKK